MLYLLISLAIFTLSFRFLARLQARCQALVAKLNAQQGLSFDAGHLLGYPAPAFLVFDSRNRKIAACDVVNDADSTPFGHSAHADPDTCSTIIRTGSRSAATQGLHC